MASLREEIEHAFPDTGVPTEDMRVLAPSLKTITAEEFAARLPAFMMASVVDPIEADPIPAILISQVPKRAEQIRALSPLQRRIIARFIATTAGDHELRKGSLLEALNVLKA